MSDQIAHKVSVAITVEWILKQAGTLQTGKSGTTTATVFDEVDGSFSTPTVTEPISGVYRCSFTPDTAGLWHVKIVETSLPEAIVMSYRIVAVVDSEDLAAILTDTAAMQPTVATNLDATVSSRATPAQVNTEVDTALADVRLDELIQNAASPATPTINSFLDRMTSKDGSQAYDRSTDSLEAIRDGLAGGGLTQQNVRDAMKLAPTVGAPAAGSVDEHLDDILADTAVIEPLVSTNLNATVSSRATQASVDTIDGIVDAILLDTAAMEPLVSANVDAQISSRATPAQVNAEVDTALGDIRLDELIQNAAAPVTPTINSFMDRITSKDGLQTYDRSTDSLEAVRDSVGGGGLTQQQVRDSMKLAPTAGAPAAGSVDLHLDEIEADTAAMQPLVDVAISTRASAANLALVQADTTAILADTNVIEPLVSANLDMAISAIPTAQENTDDLLDELIAGHLDPGSVGEAINDAAAGGAGLTQQQVADALLLAPAGGPAAGSVYAEFDLLMGPGFNSATDSLEEIRNEVDACCGVGGGGPDDINIEGI